MPQDENTLKIPVNLIRSFNSLREAMEDVFPEPGSTSSGIENSSNSEDNSKSTKPGSARQNLDLNLAEIAAIKIYLEKTIAAYQFRSIPSLGVENRALYLEIEKLFYPPAFTDKRIGLIRPEKDDGLYSGASPLSMTSIFQRYRKFLLVGQAGSGKTIFLLYQAVTHAQNLLGLLSVDNYSTISPDQSSVTVNKSTKSSRSEILLPVFISLREFGRFLKDNPGNSVTDNPALLWNYIFGLPDCASTSAFSKPGKYFDHFFSTGKAILLMDGLDEVPETQVRSRILQIIQKFSKKYTSCRYIITTRPQPALGMITPISKFGTLEINPILRTDAVKFIRTLIANRIQVNEFPGVPALSEDTADLTEKFTSVINSKPGIWKTSNTHSSIIIQLILFINNKDVHEQFTDNLDDLLGMLINYDSSGQISSEKSSVKDPGLERFRKLVTGIAFWLHQNYLYEFSISDISSIYSNLIKNDPLFEGVSSTEVITIFSNYLDQQTGLFLNKPGQKIKFVWRTIQEFLAADFLVKKDDSTAFSRKCISSAWWYPVLKFETHFLQKLPPFRLSEFLEIFLNAEQVPALDAAFVVNLGFECISGLLPEGLNTSLSDELVKSFRKLQVLPLQGVQVKDIYNKFRANSSLPQLPTWQKAARFWSEPFGEPEWVDVPSGPFWMGVAGNINNFLHQVWLPSFQISRIPVTNDQYALFAADTLRDAPVHWLSNTVPAGLENHPVVNVSWYDAIAYCQWLSSKTGKNVTLPSEAEWEKSARGISDQREYPWGNWEKLHANTSEFKLSQTSPVDLFPNGASPFGCLDMTGNVREWTRSLADFDYPYDHQDLPREDLNAADDKPRILRGGSYYYHKNNARVTSRQRFLPDFKFSNFGFRIVKRSENAGN